MADLTFRFDPVIEEHYDRQLAEIRAYAERFAPRDFVGVEIGTNRGKFLAALAERHPERDYVGVELRKSLAETAQRRLARRGCDNAHVLRADANHVLPILFDDGQLDELYLLYPDPWWKAKHHKRRIIQPHFLDLLAQKMHDASMVWIRTDVAPLAEAMRETLEAHERFAALPFEDYPLEAMPHTTREMHCIEDAIPTHLLYYRCLGS